MQPLTLLSRAIARVFDLAALVIYADPRPPSRLDLRRRTARALGLPPPRRMPPPR